MLLVSLDAVYASFLDFYYQECKPIWQTISFICMNMIAWFSMPISTYFRDALMARLRASLAGWNSFTIAEWNLYYHFFIDDKVARPRASRYFMPLIFTRERPFHFFILRMYRGRALFYLRFSRVNTLIFCNYEVPQNKHDQSADIKYFDYRLTITDSSHFDRRLQCSFRFLSKAWIKY